MYYIVLYVFFILICIDVMKRISVSHIRKISLLRLLGLSAVKQVDFNLISKV